MNQQHFTHKFGNGHCVHYRRLASGTRVFQNTVNRLFFVLSNAFCDDDYPKSLSSPHRHRGKLSLGKKNLSLWRVLADEC